MAYIRIGENDSALGFFGCGASCRCAPCRSQNAAFGEWYVQEEEPERQRTRTSPKPARTPPEPGRTNMYLYAKEGLGQIPTTLQTRKLTRSGYAFGPAPSAVEGFGQPSSPTQPAGPVFVLQCPAPPGCPPFLAGQCRAVLRQAIIEAIKLANNAANKIEVATKTEPEKRDLETKKTAKLFKFFFGHDPGSQSRMPAMRRRASASRSGSGRLRKH